MGSVRTLSLLGGVMVVVLAFWSSMSPFVAKSSRQQLRQTIEEGDEGTLLSNTEATPAGGADNHDGGKGSSGHGPDQRNPSALIEQHGPAASDPEIVDGVLQKRAFSSKMRLVFLVGLEGTGHHYMADVLDKTCKTADVPCPKVCSLAKVLYPGLGNPASRQSYQEARGKLREELQALALAATRLPEGKATVVSFGMCRFQVGMMSYPNFNGVLKTLQYVDFRLLAEEAERAGIDLRFVYLSRSAKDVLISDTKHNNYGDTFMLEARILLANAAVVESLFREVDPEFTTCFRYDDMSDPSEAARVSQFVAPTEYAAKRLASTMLDAVKTPTENSKSRYGKKHGNLEGVGGGGARDRLWNRHTANEAEGVMDQAQEMVVDRLQQKMDTIERDQCPSV